jgi:Domain of unknown function (DUF4034)
MKFAGLVLFLAALSSAASSAWASGSDEFRSLVERVGDEVRAREFEKLDQEADRLRLDKSRLSDGRWKLAIFFGAVDEALPDIIQSPRRRATFEAELADYMKQHPESMNAPLILAKVAQTIGWQARGHGLAKTVTDQGWRTFNLSMRTAAAILDEHRARLAQHPQWHCERLLVATYLSEPDPVVRKIFDEGMRQEPAYLSLYFTMQMRLSKQWNGSNQALMAFINDVGLRSPAAAKEGLYARMVWYGSALYSRIELDPALDWNAMRKGMDAIVKSYPAERNVQKMFFVACGHPDREQARKLLPLMHQEPLREVLNTNVPVFRLCVEWAEGKLDEFIMGDPDTGQDRLIR